MGQDATPATTGDQGERGARGSRLGLPAHGRGALAPTGRRLAAFLVDAVLSALVAGLFTAPSLPGNWSLLAFAAENVFFVALFGQTVGMRVLGLRVVRLPPADRPVGVPRAAVRTVLLVLLVPALIWDRDGRGMHDRAARTAVIAIR